MSEEVTLSVKEEANGEHVLLHVQSSAQLVAQQGMDEKGTTFLSVETVALTEGTWNDFVFTERVIHESAAMFSGKPVVEEHTFGDSGVVGGVSSAENFPGGVKSKFVVFNQQSIQKIQSGEKVGVSVHFMVDLSEKRVVNKVLDMVELSLVAEPACKEALLIASKEVNVEMSARKPSPSGLADVNAEWNFRAADYDIDQLVNASLWVDEKPRSELTKNDTKLPVLTPEGKLVFRAVVAAGSALVGGRGGVNIPSSDKGKIAKTLAGFYKKFDKEAPDGLKKLAGITLSENKTTGEISMSEETEAVKLADENETLKAELSKLRDEKAQAEAKLSEEGEALKVEVAKLRAERRVQLAKDVAGKFVSEGKLAPAAEDLFVALHAKLDDEKQNALALLFEAQTPVIETGQQSEVDSEPTPKEDISLSEERMVEELLADATLKEQFYALSGMGPVVKGAE